MEAVEVNFDGITYAKGASVLKQLVAYVGDRRVPRRRARLLPPARVGQHHAGRPARPRSSDDLRPRPVRLVAAVAGDRRGQHAAPGVRARRRRHGTRRSRSCRRPPRRAHARRCARTGSRSACTTRAARQAGPHRAGRAGRRRRAHRGARAGRRRPAGPAAGQRRRPDLRQDPARRALAARPLVEPARRASPTRCRARCAGPPPGT